MFFIIFIKNAFFNVFYFLERFLIFYWRNYFYPTKPARNPTEPAKLLHKTTFK